MLAVGGGVDLADEVAVEALAFDETFIAVLEKLKDFLRGELSLDVASAYIDVLDLVADGVSVLEAGQADLNAADRRLIVLELADDAEDIRVDVVGGACVEDDVIPFFETGKGGGELGAIEEADLVGELEASDWAADMAFPDDVKATLKVAVEDEQEADAEADEDADEEVCEDDGE